MHASILFPAPRPGTTPPKSKSRAQTVRGSCYIIRKFQASVFVCRSPRFRGYPAGTVIPRDLPHEQHRPIVSPRPLALPPIAYWCLRCAGLRLNCLSAPHGFVLLPPRCPAFAPHGYPAERRCDRNVRGHAFSRSFLIPGLVCQDDAILASPV